MDYTQELQVSVNPGTNDHYSIRWNNRRGYWLASRNMPGMNQSARLSALDTDNLLDIFRFMRDILTGTIDPDLITPDL